MKKFNCPVCNKELIRLEPFEKGVYEFWCDDCDIDIVITENDELSKAKRLNPDEIKKLADWLMMTEAEAEEVACIFADIYDNEQKCKRGWKISRPLETVDDYIKEWEGHWHREYGWENYYLYEKENCFYDYAETDEEINEIFASLETFKEYNDTFGVAYELECSDMIIIVC